MPTNKQWTMNCILTGAGVYRQLLRGQTDVARLILTNLTSELEPNEIDYLLNRIKDLPSQ